MTAAPTFSIAEIRCHERPVTLRLPFRFGAVTVTHAPQAFVRARIRLADGREAWGISAELMVPKWFDKTASLTEAASFDQLRTSLAAAASAYASDTTARTAFGHFAAHHRTLLDHAATHGMPALAAGFGPAEIDKALLDALGRALGLGFADLIRTNAAGIAPAALLAEFGGFDFDAFLRTLQPRESVAVRHTVGMLDAIDGAPRVADDGLPESLAEAITTCGLRFFKIKLAGDVAQDVQRLHAIAAVLDAHAGDYRVTLDGNEQYDDLDRLGALWEEVRAGPGLADLCARILFIEQPVHRGVALQRDLGPLGTSVPVIIDESDANLDAFPAARTRGYAGVSSKACKGLYKSLVNRARCTRWNADAGRERWFMSGEDLTTQAGLGVQQDLALAAILGIAHVERNGHHYVNGFAGQHAPELEQDAFLAAHPDLYERSHGSVRVRIRDGTVHLASLRGPGFASGAQPDWSSLAPLATPTSELQRT